MGILNVLTLMCLIPVTSKNYFNSVLTGEEQVPWCKRHLKHLYTKKYPTVRLLTIDNLLSFVAYLQSVNLTVATPIYCQTASSFIY